MSEDTPVVGLRERKRYAAMRLVQEVALDLFDAHGYVDVTVERIAAASDISPSSVYRYFGTKEHIVLWDENDPIWSHVEVLDDLPSALIDRLRHYFETYKVLPDQPADVSIGEAYGREHAEKVVLAAMSDYEAAFGSE